MNDISATMRQAPDSAVFDEVGDPIRLEVHEVRYLDLSGDGVPDAVERVDRTAWRTQGSRFVNRVEETRRLEYGIGVDGRPSGVTEHTTIFERDAHGKLWVAERATA